MGLNVNVKSIETPRKELEVHYYKTVHSGLLELGLETHYLTDYVKCEMPERVISHRSNIDKSKTIPRAKCR